ncbi:MAG: Gfo/Idh/MocA family oxidoreductase [Pirellulales bacterium]
MSQFNRRNFLQTSAVAAAATTLAANTARADVNSKIRAAVIGVNGRGRTHMEGFEHTPGVEVAVLCDPDEKVLAERKAEFEKHFGHSVDTETDLRRVYDRNDIDVVGIATPNHWHTLAAIWACQAGKDVYVEKPGSHNLFEGRKLIEAAKKYNRIVQHGVQLRSNPVLREAVQQLHDGLIGDVYLSRALIFKTRPSIGHVPDETPPSSLNWDLWQGPAAERPFSPRYVHYNWHWHWDYGNGDVGNQGVHETDMALWGAGVGLPSEIVALGGKFLWDDDKETPETLTCSYLYPEQKKMIEVAVRPWHSNEEGGVRIGNLFYGSEGYMTIEGYDSYKTFLGSKREPGPAGSFDGNTEHEHFANFIDAVRSRDVSKLHGPPETAHTSSGLAHLGNIAYRLGRKLHFDPTTERFKNDAEADAMLTRKYRAGYEVPEVV